jgi:hypothetical protein
VDIAGGFEVAAALRLRGYSPPRVLRELVRAGARALIRRSVRFMAKFVYTLHFVGQTSRTAEHAEVLHTSGSATSCVMSTTVRPTGIQTDLKAAEGDLAFFESELHVTGPGEFQEVGEISFGEASENILRFATLGEGHLARDLEPGILAGSATWNVQGGEGKFASARGFITSTFTIDSSGERRDFHCGLIFVPE